MAPHYPQRSSDDETEFGEDQTHEDIEDFLPDNKEISPEDHQNLIEFLSRVEPIASTENTYLIIGSYDEDLRRVNLVRDIINREQSKLAIAFGDFIDIGDDIAMRFQLLAELVDYVILVADEFEVDNYGFEIGVLSNSVYIDKVYMLKSTSGANESDRSALLNQFLSLLEKRNRIRHWEDMNGLREAVHELPGIEA